MWKFDMVSVGQSRGAEEAYAEDIYSSGHDGRTRK